MAPGPVRTMPDKAKKYNKSERTHEENQERAYIAASRRSDRSLEARMESARRASEIHRRRCGRAFRITEEAVLNEEMYEGEDPDYGQRVSRIYAALANDASLIHQQWLQSQRIRFDQATNSFVVNPLFQGYVPNAPPVSQESMPFFAYQPGSQPISTPIPQTASPVVQISSPSAVMNTSSRSNSQTVQSPRAQASPLTMTQSMPHGIFEDNPDPQAAQLNFFTYPSAKFGNFDFSFPDLTQPSGLDQLNQAPMSPTSVPQNPFAYSNMFSPAFNSALNPQSPQPQQIQQNQTLQLSSGHGPPTPASGSTFLAPSAESKKFASPYSALLAADEQTLLDMQSKLMKSSTATTPGPQTEEATEISYDDWLAIPGSQG